MGQTIEDQEIKQDESLSMEYTIAKSGIYDNINYFVRNTEMNKFSIITQDIIDIIAKCFVPITESYYIWIWLTHQRSCGGKYCEIMPTMS